MYKFKVWYNRYGYGHDMKKNTSVGIVSGKNIEEAIEKICRAIKEDEILLVKCEMEELIGGAE